MGSNSAKENFFFEGYDVCLWHGFFIKKAALFGGFQFVLLSDEDGVLRSRVHCWTRRGAYCNNINFNPRAKDDATVSEIIIRYTALAVKLIEEY